MAKYIRLTPSERSLSDVQIWASGESNFQTFAPSGAVETSGIARYPYNWGIDGLDYNILPLNGKTENDGILYGSISGIVAKTGAIPQDLQDRKFITNKSNLEFEKMDSQPEHVNHKPIIHAVPVVPSGYTSILIPSGLEWEWQQNG